VGTTIDARTDFTIGGTVITDALITDDGILQINATTRTEFIGSGDLRVGVNDNTFGAVRAFGNGAASIQGGQFFAYTAADHDATVQNFSIQVSSAELWIGPDTNTDVMKFLEAGTVQFTEAVDVDAALSATTVDADTDFTVGGTVITDNTITDDGAFTITSATSTTLTSTLGVGNSASIYIGESDSVRGLLYIQSDDNTSGPQLTFQVPPDADGSGTTSGIIYIPDNTDDLHIGLNNDTDMLTFLGGATPSIKANCAVDVDAALTATTVDADTDFTVGGTVISDATITDDGVLALVPTTRVDITGTGTVRMGISDNTRGSLYLSGDTTGQTAGGRVYFETCADYDATIDHFVISAVEDDFHLGPSTNTDSLNYTGANNTWNFTEDVTFSGVTIDDLGTVTTGAITTITGNTSLVHGDIAKVEWDPSPASDATMTGDMISQTVDANASGIGALLYKAADGNWEEADADSSATMGMLGIAVESGTGTKDVLIRGFVKDTAWSWTPGAQLFASTTTGAITATAPSGTGDIVQVVGYATEATVMYFNPSVDFIEIA
jgi:hypothetical protein